MSITSNLYPPIMHDVYAAFIRTEACKIYFAISKYNSMKEISNVQVTLTNIKTNASAFKTSLYPTGIKLTTLNKDSKISDDYCYYIVINPTDLVNNAFDLNQYYKIQMRFTSTDAASINIDKTQSIATWLNDNRSFFSEWSRSCLIRGIAKPSITLNYLKANDSVTLTAPLSKIDGKLTFANSQEQDYLSEYKIKVYAGNKLKSDGLIYDSGVIYTDQETPNNISCDLLCNLENKQSYVITFNYTTFQLYNEQIEYFITINSNTTNNPYGLAITAAENQEDGYINVHMSMTRYATFPKTYQVLLRRSSSKDNFQTLENLFTFNHGFSSIDWQDLSIENGIWYKYSVYILNKNNTTLYTPIQTNPILCQFEDIFLIGDNIQLRLQFNPAITGFKYNVSESQQITLGGKFPYIKRNGNNYYRSFGVSGLISSLVDNTEWFDSYLYNSQQEEEKLRHITFTSKENQYKKSYNLYQTYEQNNQISDYLNPIYERFFREAIYDFLYAETAKLFKSPTEGNILVKLTGITFQPIASLGRILYSFSATAVQIDEPTFDNYKKYDIILNNVLVTESPALNINQKFSNMVVTINATGADYSGTKTDGHWNLHIEPHWTEGGKLS